MGLESPWFTHYSSSSPSPGSSSVSSPASGTPWGGVRSGRLGTGEPLGLSSSSRRMGGRGFRFFYEDGGDGIGQVFRHGDAVAVNQELPASGPAAGSARPPGTGVQRRLTLDRWEMTSRLPCCAREPWVFHREIRWEISGSWLIRASTCSGPNTNSCLGKR